MRRLALALVAVLIALLLWSCSDNQAPSTSSVCQVSAQILAFGSIPVGQSADRTFTITNTGGGTLTGTVTASCVGFAIVGSTTYRLDGGQSATFMVRYSPSQAGTHTCVVNTGCTQTVSCTAQALQPVSCTVSPSALYFGDVAFGQSADRTFTITSAGGGTLSGTVAVCNPPFSVVGSASYNLAVGESDTMTVRFTPTAPGNIGCNMNIGSSCGTVSIEGNCVTCDVSPTVVDFGAVPFGTQATRDVTVRNLYSSEQTYIVDHCATQVFTVRPLYLRVLPGESGVISVRYDANVCEGNSCDFGLSVAGGGCDVTVHCTATTSGGLDFGDVVVGQTAVRDIVVYDPCPGGNGTYSICSSENGSDFSMSPYCLHNWTARFPMTFHIYFSPLTTGVQSCTARVIYECEPNTPGGYRTAREICCSGRGVQ